MQLGFFFDQTRCTGCFACVIACKDWHDTPAGPAKWMRISYREEGTYPDLFVSYSATPCYHCANPVCSYVCPNEAITKDADNGVVVVDRDKCRGTRDCGIISSVATGSKYRYDELLSPCQIACPAHLHVPGYVALIAKGKFKESLELIRQRMPLPSVCGRVCLKPCETECRRQEVDRSIAIGSLKRFVADYVPQELPQRIPSTQDRRVAIVGSGPAGLAAAYDLIRMGYGVTVFEALSIPGGMLAVGIPQYRLPKEVLKRDIDYLEALGVEIKTKTPIGRELSLQDVFAQGHDAVLLALGAHIGQKLNIPGADMEGVMVATTFMRDVSFHKDVRVGKRVLVIGGGNVALDCARTALRLGAAEVRLACLECREDMPADKAEIKQAEEEGIQLYPASTPTRIIGSQREIRCVEFLRVRELRVDEDGRPQFNVVQGSEYDVPADTVIFAIGQAPDLTGLENEDNIRIHKRGTIVVDPETLMTGYRGVFCAGDVVHGTTSVIEAIAEGQKAAFYINRYLQGDVVRVKPKNNIQAKDIKVSIPVKLEKREPRYESYLPVPQRVSNFKEVCLGFNLEDAIEEASRCLNCAGHLCKDVCPYGAPQFADEERPKMQKCDLCLDRYLENKKPICVEACPVRALDSGEITVLRERYGHVQDAHGLVDSPVVQPSVVTKPKHRRSQLVGRDKKGEE